MTKHTPECQAEQEREQRLLAESQAALAAWQARWPSACPNCGARGVRHFDGGRHEPPSDHLCEGAGHKRPTTLIERQWMRVTFFASHVWTLLRRGLRGDFPRLWYLRGYFTYYPPRKVWVTTHKCLEHGVCPRCGKATITDASTDDEFRFTCRACGWHSENAGGEEGNDFAPEVYEIYPGPCACEEAAWAAEMASWPAPTDAELTEMLAKDDSDERDTRIIFDRF